MLVKESKAEYPLSLSRVFSKGLLGVHFVYLGTDVKNMQQNPEFLCVEGLQKAGKSLNVKFSRKWRISTRIMRNLSESHCVLNYEHSLKSAKCFVYVDTGHFCPVRSGRKKSVRLDVMLRNKKPKIQQLYGIRTQADIDRFSRLEGQIKNAIRSGVYYPNKSYMCEICGYQEMCEKWLSA